MSTRHAKAPRALDRCGRIATRRFPRCALGAAVVLAAASGYAADESFERDRFETLDPRMPAIEFRRPLVEPRQPNVEYRRPLVDFRRPSVEFRRPAIERGDPVCTDCAARDQDDPGQTED